jgi:hypothetical protein
MYVAYVEYAPLKEYEVTYTLKGKKYQDVVRANSSTDARELVKTRYKDARIISVREVKK